MTAVTKRVSRHPLQLGNLQGPGLAVDDQRGREEQQRADDAPCQADERHTCALPVAEVRHQEEQRDGQDLEEEVHRDQVGAEDRADEPDREEREQVEEPGVVRCPCRRGLRAVEPRDSLLHVADRVEGQRRAEDAHDHENWQAEAICQQAEPDVRGYQQVLLGEHGSAQYGQGSRHGQAGRIDQSQRRDPSGQVPEPPPGGEDQHRRQGRHQENLKQQCLHHELPERSSASSSTRSTSTYDMLETMSSASARMCPSKRPATSRNTRGR